MRATFCRRPHPPTAFVRTETLLYNTNMSKERLLGLQGGGIGAGARDSEEMMLAGLAPEGTREWHERRSGLPVGAVKTVVPGQYEQARANKYSNRNNFARFISVSF